MSNYVIWMNTPGAEGCVLETVENLENPLDLTEGVSMQPWPDNVVFLMDPNFPKAIKLTDSIMNLQDALVVSKSLKDLVEKRNPAYIEYLSVSIVNHKGRIAATDYFILNITKLQDCIDLEQSEIEWNALDSQSICACTRMIIDETRIEPGSIIFRLKYYPTKVLVRRDLADEIMEHNMTGLEFIEIEDIEY